MKRISVLLAVVLVLTAILPIQIFAAGDNGLQKAITDVKSRITIPAELPDINYSFNSQGDRNIWELSWYNKTEDKGRLYVTIDTKGIIYNYNYYKPSYYDPTIVNKKIIPVITRDEAAARAKSFARKLNPSLYPKVELLPDTQRYYVGGEEYYFTFTRVANGIPFYENSMSVSVSQRTGEVQNFNMSWNDKVIFPSASKAISKDAAAKAYAEKLGLKLIYRSSYEKDTIRTYPVYVPKDVSNSYIDALTGEKIQISRYWDIAYAGKSAATKEESQDQAAGSGLSPQEEEAVIKVNSLISKEDAEAKLRSIEELGLTADFTASWVSLSQIWNEKDKFLWNFSFTTPQTDKDEYRYCAATLDAQTGALLSFYKSTPVKEGEVPTWTEAQAKEAVETFLKKMQPEKFAATEPSAANTPVIYPLYTENGKVQQYSFTYVRKANGIPYEDNSLNASFDAITGKITQYNCQWNDQVEFADISKAISLEKAYESLFEKVGLELQYQADYSEALNAKILPPDNRGNVTPKIKLVYALNGQKPAQIDALSGELVGYDGVSPYTEPTVPNYSDISGHYAEKEIKALMESGIVLDGTEFKPDTNIAQKDFLKLLSMSLNSYYYEPMYKEGTSDAETDGIYQNLSRMGIIKEGEAAPDASVTREEAVKFIIRALKLEKVAKIQGIYKVDFKDADQIQPELLGYVALASGMEIVKGNNGNFNPKGQLTRGQAAIVIYNFLTK